MSVRAGSVARLRADLGRHDLELLRAWPRSGEHLLLHLGPTGGETRDASPGWVAGQWFADDTRSASVARSTDGARHLSGTGVVLQPAGADRRLTALAGLLHEPGTELVAHRPERRAVVRSRSASGGHRWTKVVGASRLDPLLASARWRPEGVRVPEVVAVDPRAGSVTTAHLPGRTLHALGDRPGADEAPWRCAGETVATLHRSGPPPGAGRHGPTDEAAVTRTWLDRAQQHGTVDARRLHGYRQVVDRAVTGLQGTPPRRAATVHRDLHDKQVVVLGDAAALLDLDLVAVGEPGLDVANLLVHLVLRDEQAAGVGPGGHAPAAPARARAFLEGYGPLEDRARLHGLALLAAVRVAAVYSFRRPLRPDPVGADAPGGAAGVPDVGGVEVGDRLVRSVLAGVPGL